MTLQDAPPETYQLPEDLTPLVSQLLQANLPTLPHIPFSQNTEPKYFTSETLVIGKEAPPGTLSEQQVLYQLLANLEELFKEFSEQGLEYKCLPPNLQKRLEATPSGTPSP